MTDLRQPNRIIDRGLSAALFVPARHKPLYIHQNGLGTLADCVAGDLVVFAVTPAIVARPGHFGIAFREGDVHFGSVGWVDPPDVFVACSDLGSWNWRSDAAHLKCLPESTPVRFFALRPGRG